MPGAPTALDEDAVASLVKKAREAYEDETSRTRQEVSTPDPAGAATGSRTMSNEDLQLIKEFAFLSKFSEGFIKNTPLSELLKLQATHTKLSEIDKGKDAEDRLTANKDNLGRVFTDVPQGRDNRWTVLHPARYLPGAGVTTTKHWLQARQETGLKGHPPIGNYDMSGVGLAGIVTAKGWIEIHNPASTKISLKMFNCANCASKTKAQEEDEICELGEFKLALRALRVAQRQATPWNYSAEALEGFFLQNNYCQAETANLDRRAQFLTQFVDYVLSQNAERWRNEQPFLNTGELKNTWSTFYGVRPVPVSKKKEAFARPTKKGPPNQARTPGICWGWNEGRCLKTATDCKTPKGYALRHVCNFVADPQKPDDICGKEHIRIKFH